MTPATHPDKHLDADELHALSLRTLHDYDHDAHGFCTGTEDHDVSQNIDALLSAISHPPPCRILDFGCGPGRDLCEFIARGHAPVGLDGARAFVEMARERCDCEVWLQNFLALDLPHEHFDGVFANASLFHVPKQELARVLHALWETLKPEGVLFASNPRGNNQEGWNGNRYGCFHDLEHWRKHVTAAGFTELHHYYRPAGKPCAQQPWLATVWRKVVSS